MFCRYVGLHVSVPCQIFVTVVGEGSSCAYCPRSPLVRHCRYVVSCRDSVTRSRSKSTSWNARRRRGTVDRGLGTCRRRTGSYEATRLTRSRAGRYRDTHIKPWRTEHGEPTSSACKRQSPRTRTANRSNIVSGRCYFCFEYFSS